MTARQKIYLWTILVLWMIVMDKFIKSATKKKIFSAS